MINSYKRTLLAFLFVFGAALFCFAADQAQPWNFPRFSDDISGLYKAASSVTTPAGTAVSVIDDEESYIFDSDGKAVHTRYVLYKVLTQNGVDDWDGISMGWEPWREDLPTVRARVITPDKAVHILDPKTVTDAPEKEDDQEIYSDRRVIRAPLPAVAPGSLVEQEVITKESKVLFGAGTVDQDFFGRPVPTYFSRLIIDAPTSLPIRYRIEMLPGLRPERKEENGRAIFTFSMGRMDPLEDAESDLPSDEPYYPSITFSTGDSWEHVAGEYDRIADAQIALSDVKPIVNTVIAGKESRDTKAAAILAYVDREVRYTGVEFGEASITPRSPGETLKRKYGDCKDKAALLVSMLRTAGIPSYLALLNASSREDVPEGLPGMGLFDHAIVYVPGTPDLWIDVTDEYARLGQLPSDDQGRLALIARAGTNSLVRIPEMTSEENLLVEKREFFLAEYGAARIIETSQPNGTIESSYRSSYADKENKATKDELTNYVKSQYLTEKLDRIDRSDPNDISKQFELVLECDHAKRGFTDLNTAAAAIRFDSLFSRLPSDLQEREKEKAKGAEALSEKSEKTRVADFQLPAAFVTEWDYTIVPPAGYQPKPLPANANIALGPARLTEEFSAEAGGVVKATIRFDTVKRRFNVSEAVAMRNKIADLRQGQPILIYFEPTAQALLIAGKVRESFQATRDLIASHPNEAVPYLMRANALVAGGMGQAAREEARLAVKLEPNSALAQKTLADILEYDSVGRRYRPGSDYAGAEVAYRAAIKLDPDDNASVANLAILLEYNRWGLRYGPGARLKDAVAEYRKLTAENLAELGAKNNLAFALFYAGDVAESLKATEGLNPSPTALIVACQTVILGSHDGIAEARKRTEGDAQFKQIVKAAGQILENVRRYSLAADLLEAGASGDDATENAADAIALRRTQPHEQMVFADDAVGVAMHFYAFSMSPDLTLDQILSTTSRNGKIAMGTQETAAFYANSERAVYSSKARSGLFADVGVDLSLSKSQPIIEENDRGEYKITFFPSASYKGSMYLVKENGKFGVLANWDNHSGIGLEVLDRVAAGDLAGARALLDWLREDVHLAGGDDPLEGAAFPHFWTKGKNADAAVMKLAAASILAEKKETAARGIPLLEAARDSATRDSEKLNIELALLTAFNSLNEEGYAGALAACIELAKEYPESLRVFNNQSYDLRALGRYEEAERLAEDRMRRIPGDRDALYALALNAIVQEDYARAYALHQKIIDSGKATPNDLNAISWDSLFTGKTGNADIEYALKAAQLSPNNFGILHTLGCVYAEVGKAKEARDVLIQAMDQLNLDEPEENYWYAFGRVAEQYGETKAAITDYNLVEKPKIPYGIQSTSYYLAQKRLKALADSAGGAKPPGK